jgi:hypothetical protein
VGTENDAVAAIMGIVEKAMTERLQRSYCLASREEREGRLRAIMALSVELTRLTAESLFATGLAAQVIEDIIEGEWGSAYKLGLHFTFDDEHEDTRSVEGPRWAKFVEIVRVERGMRPC